MRLSMIAAASLTLALAPAATAQPDGYTARGTEPFWSLTIGARTMRFEAPGQRPVTIDTPRVIHGFAGEIYQTRAIDVNIVHGACNDGMSDRTYRDSVTVRVNGRSYKGCGGDAVAAPAPVSVIEGPWRIESIAGKPPVPGTNPRIDFEGARVSGNTGCNSFGGKYQFDRGFLTAGALISTRRACTRQTNAQEQALLDLLGQRLSVSSNRGGKLVMRGRRGDTLVLVRAGRR